MWSPAAGPCRSALGVSMAPQTLRGNATPSSGHGSHFAIPANANAVLWGYFLKSGQAGGRGRVGRYATIETLTHHANAARTHGQATQARKASSIGTRRGASTGARSGRWTPKVGAGGRRGDARVHRAGAHQGCGTGRHPWKCASSTACRARRQPTSRARPSAATPRPTELPLRRHADQAKEREVVTIYGSTPPANTTGPARSGFRWTPQTDPFGVDASTIDYQACRWTWTITRTNVAAGNAASRCGPTSARWAWRRPRPGLVTSIPPNFHRRQHRQLAHRQGATLPLPGRRGGHDVLRSVTRMRHGAAPSNAARRSRCSLTGTFGSSLHRRPAACPAPLAELKVPVAGNRRTQCGLLRISATPYYRSSQSWARTLRTRSTKKSSVDKALPGAVSQDAPLPDDHAGTSPETGSLADVHRVSTSHHAGGRRHPLGRPAAASGG